MQHFGIIIGVGNEHRKGDGLGPAVVRRLQEGVSCDVADWDLAIIDGDILGLLPLLHGYRRALIVDAVLLPESPPGTVVFWRVDQHAIPVDSFLPSSHALSLSHVLELARVLGDLPAYCAVMGVVTRPGDERRDGTQDVTFALDQLLQELPRS